MYIQNPYSATNFTYTNYCQQKENMNCKRNGFNL